MRAVFKGFDVAQWLIWTHTGKALKTPRRRRRRDPGRGKSRRYGENKAFVAVEGFPLIERVANVLGSVFHRVVLVTNSPDEYKHLRLPMFEDKVKGLGPLGGILTGLSVITEEAGFLVACDMPFLNAALICYMSQMRGTFHVVVPRIRGRPGDPACPLQPHSVCRSSGGSSMQASIRSFVSSRR